MSKDDLSPIKSSADGIMQDERNCFWI